ncbi:MAG: biotin/lipoyl-containing protein, partial [Candidatus Dormibacteria bacterium]
MPKRTLEVTLPQMGESVTEGVVGSWRKRVGDEVAAGETLVEIQTDKIDAEVPAPEAGRLAKILAQEGQTIAVGAGLAELELGASGNGQIPEQEGAVGAGPAVTAPAQERADTARSTEVGELIAVPLPQMGESVTEGVVGNWTKKAGDLVRTGETLVEIQTDKVDAEVPAPASGVISAILVPEGETVAAGTVLAQIRAGGGAEASVGAQPTIASVAAADRPAAATPLARRRAYLQHVDLATVRGSGPGGLVRGGDVTARPADSPATVPAPVSAEPIKGTRLALVHAMEESLSIPTATSFRTVEVGVLEARRRQLNQALAQRHPQTKISYTHLIAFALTWAARETA